MTLLLEKNPEYIFDVIESPTFQHFHMLFGFFRPAGRAQTSAGWCCNLQEKNLLFQGGWSSFLKDPFVFSWILYRCCNCAWEPHPDMKYALQSVLPHTTETRPCAFDKWNGSLTWLYRCHIATMAMMWLVFEPWTFDSETFLQKGFISYTGQIIFSCPPAFFLLTKFHLVSAEVGTTIPSLMCITRINKIILVLVSLSHLTVKFFSWCKPLLMKMHIF